MIIRRLRRLRRKGKAKTVEPTPSLFYFPKWPFVLRRLTWKAFRSPSSSTFSAKQTSNILFSWQEIMLPGEQSLVVGTSAQWPLSGGPCA